MIYNNDNSNKSVKVQELPLSQNLMILSKFYIKNGVLLKNRDNKFTTLENEIKNFNDVVIEERGFVTVYCKEDKELRFLKEFKWIKTHCKIYPIDDSRIKLIVSNTKSHAC